MLGTTHPCIWSFPNPLTPGGAFQKPPVIFGQGGEPVKPSVCLRVFLPDRVSFAGPPGRLRSPGDVWIWLIPFDALLRALVKSFLRPAQGILTLGEGVAAIPASLGQLARGSPPGFAREPRGARGKERAS